MLTNINYFLEAVKEVDNKSIILFHSFQHEIAFSLHLMLTSRACVLSVNDKNGVSAPAQCKVYESLFKKAVLEDIWVQLMYI